MLLWLVRTCFIVAILSALIAGAVVYFETRHLDPTLGEDDKLTGISAFIILFMIATVAVTADLFVRHKQITTISAVYFGLLLGLVIGSLFSMALEPILLKGPPSTKDLVQPLRLLITLICCYVSVSTLLQTKDEFRFIIPYVEFSKQIKGGRPLVLDTSVIIDGRIADICDTRIIDTKLIVPRFVLQELQHIADSADKLKRNRGRRGMDMLKKLQTNPKIELLMHEGNVPEVREACDKARDDERLGMFA